jgi:hypothetical protein
LAVLIVGSFVIPMVRKLNPPSRIILQFQAKALVSLSNEIKQTKSVQAQYFWYVRDDDSSDKFFAEDVPEPPKKKGWF